MYHFEFVSKKKRAPVKRELISIIKETQNLLRADFTFRFDFVGSDKHNTVTCDLKSNIGYDFDVNLEVNDDECDYTPKEIRTKIRSCIHKRLSSVWR